MGNAFLDRQSGSNLKIDGQEKITTQFSDSFNKGDRVAITGTYLNPPIKLNTPVSGDLPTGSGLGCSFSPDGAYLAVAHDVSPYLTIYKRNGDTFTKLNTPASGDLPTSAGQGCSFSPDGTYLAVAHTGSPYITIYKRNGDTFTKLSTPASGDLPTGIGNGCSFSPNGIYLAVAHYSSPYITIYLFKKIFAQPFDSFIPEDDYSLGYALESGNTNDIKNVMKLFDIDYVEPIANLVNSVTYTGTYASTISARDYSVGFNTNGDIIITQQGVDNTSYENIYFTLSSVPIGSGITLQSHSSSLGTSRGTGIYYGAILKGVTQPVDLTFVCNTRNGTNDYYQIDITVTYA